MRREGRTLFDDVLVAIAVMGLLQQAYAAQAASRPHAHETVILKAMERCAPVPSVDGPCGAFVVGVAE